MRLRYGVYRLYDETDRLLYVGQGAIPEERVNDHRLRSPWGERIARVEVEWFTNRPDALIHERALTLTHSPEFPTRVTGSQAHREARAYVVRDLRRGPVWHGEPCPDDPKAVADKELRESGYFDDSCLTPREEPASEEDYARECADARYRIVNALDAHERAS